MLAAVLTALLVVALPPAALTGGLVQMVPALLLVGLPLAALALVAPGHWRVLFGRVGWREVKWMVLFAPLTLFARRLGTGRKSAILWAWLLSALFFGLAHLPTYDWNLIQCTAIIGTARLVLTLPWIMTKNIWVSTGAHIFDDWTIFSVELLGACLASAP